MKHAWKVALVVIAASHLGFGCDAGSGGEALTASGEESPQEPVCEPGCGEDGLCLLNVDNESACMCIGSFVGAACDACTGGTWGPYCSPCYCGERGICDEGIDGTGICACEDGWEGETCEQESLFSFPFHAEGVGTGIMDTVGDFSVETLTGGWTLSEHWTGLDTYLFVVQYGDSAHNTQVWANDPGDLIDLLEPNTHVVFLSFDDGAEMIVGEMATRVELALAERGAEAQSHWGTRFHFVPTRVFDPASGWGLSAGALKDFMEAHGYFWFAIDRMQRWREIGSLHDWNQGKARLSFIAHESSGFAYEAAITERMENLEGMRVTIMDKVEHPGGWGAGNSTRVTVELPSPGEIAQYDGLAAYTYTACPDHKQGKDAGCNEWDYIQRLDVCGTRHPADGWEGHTSCEPGSTLGCSCTEPGGEDVPSEHTCNPEGTGYGDCSCGCSEFIRWVTPYGREGRWLTDLNGLLSLIRDGHKRDFVFRGANGYTVDIELFFYKRGTDTHVIGHRYLWGNPSGTSFNEEYNTKHADVVFELPEGATRVELVTVISGHGHSSTQENCAEFCDHQHEFNLNGHTEMISHPVAGQPYGCRDQTLDGGVPNQFGTWVYGRGGWCAGMDVAPRFVELTEFVVAGPNTLSYRGLYQGQDYTPHPNGQGDYMPEIKMSSWLVFYGPTGGEEE